MDGIYFSESKRRPNVVAPLLKVATKWRKCLRHTKVVNLFYLIYTSAKFILESFNFKVDRKKESIISVSTNNLLCKQVHEISDGHRSLSDTISFVTDRFRFLPVTMTGRFSNFNSISYTKDRLKVPAAGHDVRH